jgi:hypothetical protein
MNKCYDVRGVCPKDQLYGNSLTTLGEDYQNIRVLDATQDDGTRIWPRSADAGRAVDPASMPTLLQRVGLKQYPLLDFYSMSTCPVVPEIFKLTVEELEPGVHQFFKVQIVQEGDKSLTPIGEKYWMVVCNRLATLHDTLCEPPLRANGWPDISVNGPRKFVFSASKIGLAHVWIDKRASAIGCLVSEKLQSRLAAFRITGIQFTAFDVAD